MATDYSQYSNPDFELQRQQLNRQQKMAEALLAQGQQMAQGPAGQMVSGRYVQNSPLQMLNAPINQLVGAWLSTKGDEKATALAEKVRSYGQEEVNNIMTQAMGREALPSQELAGPYDLAQKIKAPTIDYPAIQPNQAKALAMSVSASTPQGQAFAPALMANALPKNITPYEKEALRQKDEEIAIQRANANKSSFSAIEGTPYALNSRTGEIVTLKDPITGQPLAPKAPTHIQNEITAINQQKSVINGVIKNVEANKDAFGARQGFVEGLPMGGVIQNRKMTPEQVQARANVFNASSAVVKERAGTAQSPSEKETIMKFLPSPLDSSDVIISKMIGFNKYIEDKERGTTAVLGAVKPYIPNATNAAPAANSAAAPAAAPIYATNGKTRIMSTDGGNTWQPAGGQ
jgi:hypothetical protein